MNRSGLDHSLRRSDDQVIEESSETVPAIGRPDPEPELGSIGRARRTYDEPSDRDSSVRGIDDHHHAVTGSKAQLRAKRHPHSTNPDIDRLDVHRDSSCLGVGMNDQGHPPGDPAAASTIDEGVDGTDPHAQ